MLHTATAAQKVILLHLSSAASERVFSLQSMTVFQKDRTVLYLTMWRLRLCSNVINGDSVSVLLHVFVCKTGYNIENNSGIIGTKFWE